MCEGDKVCSVARDGSRVAGVEKGDAYFAFPIWIGAIYQAKRRQRDGVLTLRRVGSFGDTRTGYQPSPEYVDELKEQAPHPWMDGATHGKVIENGDER